MDDGERAREAEDRWGGTEAYAESARRVGGYTKDDLLRMRRETAEVEALVAAVVESGTEPGSDEGMVVAEMHRRHLERWFYPVPAEMHVSLGRVYVDDERFRAYYENVAAGAAEWLRDAIAANAARSD